MSLINPTLTSANSVLTVFCTEFPSGVIIDQWDQDDMWSASEVTQVEVSMAANGDLLGAYVHNPTEFKINVKPTSLSIVALEAIATAQRVIGDALRITGSLSVTGTGKVYALAGYMTSHQPIPDAGKQLKAQKFGFAFKVV